MTLGVLSAGCRIGTDKRAYVYEYRVNSHVVGKPEVTAGSYAQGFIIGDF